MVAPNNPKKKRTYATKNTGSDNAKTVVKKDDSSSPAVIGSPEFELLEKNIGTTLMTGVNVPAKPTKELLKGKDLVGLYFGGAWSTPCQEFNPTLIKFYNECAKSNGMEIIYVSSDNTKEEFHSELNKMPWLAIDGDDKGTMLKHALATNLKAYSIPTLVILNVRTGSFVTDQARKEILALLKKDDDNNKLKNGGTEDSNDFVTRGAALMETWRTMDPIPLGHDSTVITNVQNAIDYFIKNPMMAALLIAVLMSTSIVKRVIDNPLLGVAFWLIFKNWTKDKLSRNEPYMIQEEEGSSAASSSSTTTSTTSSSQKNDTTTSAEKKAQ